VVEPDLAMAWAGVTADACATEANRATEADNCAGCSIWYAMMKVLKLARGR
jgi:hypothetical protein